MKITLKHTFVTISGDYYQILFEEKVDDGSIEITDNSYFLLQRQFEMPDGGKVYIESHDENYIGHFKIKCISLQMDKFRIELERPNYSTIEITYEASEKEFKELASALNDMIPKEIIKL